VDDSECKLNCDFVISICSDFIGSIHHIPVFQNAPRLLYGVPICG
jgi:hypothetical protein